MAQLRFPRSSRALPAVRYVRPPRPLHFPEEALTLESKTHLTLRTFLYRLLHFALGAEHSVGSEQFVYWNAADPRRCLAPDVFVKLDVPDRQFGTWKTWERGGAPELAVEIVSATEGDGVTWDEKLSRYHECGVAELVRFDPAAPEGERLRVWDRVREDLVERVIADDRTPCLTLGLNWVVCPVESEPLGLRLVDDEGRLLLNDVETHAKARAEEAKARAEEAKARAEEAKARAEEAKARAAAEARVRELEAELLRRPRS
jgi:Uma2 family endonuclease